MFFGPGDATAALGDDDVHVTVYDDDGFGYPGAMLAQVIIPGGTYPSYPAEANAVFGSLVLENTFHIAISTSGIPGSTYERLVIDDASLGSGRSTGSGDPTWPGSTTWYTMLDWWGADYGFLIRANLCRDEFADCKVQDYYAGGDDCASQCPIGLPLPFVNATSWAQRFSDAPSGSECELRRLFIGLIRPQADIDAGRLAQFTYDTKVRVYGDNGGEPSSTLYQTSTITVADYIAAGFT
jgi:hypothetical protein